MNLFRNTLAFCLLLTVFYSAGQTRRVIHIPDIEGYSTLKCDFHMHTVFSDGNVWPTVRVTEAWQEGLDAIAITDHIEYRPHSAEVVSDHNKSFEIAEPVAKELGIILVRGTEITRSMPPGHLNALFISDANPIDKKDVFEAIAEAHKQGAFILWNHPGWKAQQPDTTLWWEEHSRLFANKMLQGIEVFNGDEYYPEALGWAMEKKLTPFANTDAHDPIFNAGKPRTMTLVFAKSKDNEGVKEALFSGRTLAFCNNVVAGDEKLLGQLFNASLSFDEKPLNLKMKGRATVFIMNSSDISYELVLAVKGKEFEAPETITLKAGEITPVTLRGVSKEIESLEKLSMKYKVTNMLSGNGKNFEAEFSFTNF